MSAVAGLRHAPARVLAALLCCTVVLATSCLEANTIARIDKDGSGTLTVEIALSEDLVSTMSAFAGEEFTSDELVSELRDDLPREFGDRIRFEPASSGVGVSIQIDFDDIDELNELLADSGTSDVGSDEAPITDVEFEVDGDRARFSATAAAGELVAPDDVGAAFLGDLPEPSVTFTVEMPGDIRDSNADRVEGRRATWDLTAFGGGRVRAESSLTSSWLPTWMPSWLTAPVLAGLLLAVVVLVGLLLLLLRRSGRTEPAPTSVSVPYPGQPAPGGPSVTAGWGPGGPPAPAPGAPPGRIGASTPPSGPPTPPTAPPMGPGAPGTPAGAPPSSPPQLPSLPPLGGHLPPGPQQPASSPTEPSPASSPNEPSPTEPVPTVPSGSPPVPTPDPGGPPPGWYPDPAGSPRQRWWDGSAWTDHLS